MHHDDCAKTGLDPTASGLMSARSPLPATISCLPLTQASHDRTLSSQITFPWVGALTQAVMSRAGGSRWWIRVPAIFVATVYCICG